MAGASMGISDGAKKRSRRKKKPCCDTEAEKRVEEDEAGTELVGLKDAHLLEVGSGYNVVACMQHFCVKRKVSVCVFGATGMVSHATLKVSESILRVQEGLQIVSLTGTFQEDCSFTLTVFLAGGDGKVVAGKVLGDLVALGPVIVTAASSPSPSIPTTTTSSSS